jgi:hypothetical protein
MDLRLIGLLAYQPRQPFVALMRRLAWIAFAGAAGTGAALFSIRATEYAFNPAFQAKLALIAVAGLNLAVLARAGHQNPRAARLQAALSIILWVGVLIAGRFIGFV